jgi:outer membrane protein
LEADRARQRSNDEDVSRAWGGYRPTVVASGGTGKGQDLAYVPTQNLFGQHVFERLHDHRRLDEEAVQLKQEIWDGNRTLSDVTHAKWAVANGRAILKSTEQSVLGGALQAYFDLYRDQRIVDIQQQFVAALQEEKTAATKRYGVKDVTRTDVAQAEARLARGIADLRQFQGNLESSRSAFFLATGLKPGSLVDPPNLANVPLPKDLSDALSLIEDNPDLQAAIYAEKAAEADVETLEAGLLPDVSIQATGTRYNHTDYTATQVTSGQVVLSVTMPLYDGGVASARTRGAKHTVGQRRLSVDLQRNRTEDAIRRAWENFKATEARITALEENERAAEVAVDGVHQELKVGSRTVLDELNARQEVLDAQIALLRSRHDSAVSAYSLLLACGHLTAADLALPVEIYDPAEHYDSATWMPWGPWIDTNYPESTPVSGNKMPGGNPYPYIPFINEN